MTVWSFLLESLSFGVTVAFMLFGVVGVIVPLFPGLLLVWLSLTLYAVLDGFTVINGGLYAGLTAFALITSTADLWLPLLGARATGASRRGIVYGTVGALLGFIVLNLIGAVVGYAAGVVVGEYHLHQDWQKAIKASLGGLAGIGVSTLIQLGAAIIIVVIFVWRVLTF